MKHAIILASWPDNEFAISMGERFLGVYRVYFPDSTIYVGINSGQLIDRWLDILEQAKTKLNIKYALTPKELLLTSDASAYQTALKLYRDSGETYDLAWFNHFKAASHGGHGATEDNIQKLLGERAKIEQFFLDNPEIGLYALVGWNIDHGRLDKGGPEDLVSCYYDFAYQTLRITPLYTFYTIRGAPLENFIRNCNKSFFEEILPNRFFFENDFCQVIFRQGYSCHLEDAYPGVSKHTINQTIDAWKSNNKL